MNFSRERKFLWMKIQVWMKAVSCVGKKETATVKNRPNAKGRMSQYSLLLISSLLGSSILFFIHCSLMKMWGKLVNELFSYTLNPGFFFLSPFLSWMNFSHSFLIRHRNWIEANFSFIACDLIHKIKNLKNFLWGKIVLVAGHSDYFKQIFEIPSGKILGKLLFIWNI